jgi:hypothetical protein
MLSTFFVGVDPVDCRFGVVEARSLSTSISKFDGLKQILVSTNQIADRKRPSNVDKVSNIELRYKFQNRKRNKTSRV